MSRTPRRTATAALLLAAALPATAALIAPAQASGADGARVAKVDRHRPTRPVPHASSLTGAVRFTWGTSKHATRYRVHWAPAAYDQWPKSLAWFVDRTSGGWVSKARRSSVKTVPTNAATDRTMTALPYGNPLFGQVQANNARARKGATNKSTWVMGFPGVPGPGSGTTFRMGTYNILGSGANFDGRLPYLAKNIADHRLDVVALEEIRKGNITKVLAALTARTGDRWTAATTSTDELAVVYRANRFAESGAGTFSITNYNKGASMPNPWVRLTPTTGGQAFYVVPAHFVPSMPSDGRYQAANNKQTGQNAVQVVNALRSFVPDGSPVIVAGDFTSNHTHFGDITPAQPTFVRVGGFWDALTARTKSGVAFGTVNKRAHQKRANSGLGGRPDAILLRGFRYGGTTTWVNVYNWTGGASLPPSDHNLVYADVVLPD